MPEAEWAVIGTDMFSYEDYPKALCTTKEVAWNVAQAYTDTQKMIQPGGLSDRFSAYPLPNAARRCDMSVDEFRAFVKAMSNAQR